MPSTATSALPAFSAAAALLSPPLVGPEVMRQGIAKACTEARLADQEAAPQLLPLIQHLSRLSTEWNTPHFDDILHEHARHYQDPSRVKARLCAEIAFFQALYRPARNFRIYPVDAYCFDDGLFFPTILFESGERVFGCADFMSHPETMVLDYVQGMSSATAQEQRELFGRPWFELFMERVIESSAFLQELGVKMMLRVEEHYRLPRMVRDRYFARTPAASGNLYALAIERERVRQHLERAKTDAAAMATRWSGDDGEMRGLE